MIKIYDPMLGEKLNYTWFSHPRPWKMSVGQLLDLRIEPGCIRASFSVSREEAEASPRWDAENERVMLELLDAEGRVVNENWLKFAGRSAIRADLCLGDPNVLDRFME